jgi:hypothetical protein
MKEEERYLRAMENKIASQSDIKAFALDILLAEGIDPSIINLKDDGISIESFKKLINGLYLAGYKDGMERIKTAMPDKEPPF